MEKPTPNNILLDQIMNPNIPKTEREHWASKRIAKQLIADLESGVYEYERPYG